MVAGMIYNKLNKFNHCGDYILLSDVINYKYTSTNIWLTPMPFYLVECLDVPMNARREYLCILIEVYWEWQRLATREGGLQKEAFTEYRRFTYGELLPPTILNIVLDVVFQH